ncbi:MAG: hypothetical protein GC155_08475 [Alphaproteobacteria bacterium]|nr:hypothetical protein [Alphaproteobacteria bacterium]
MQWTVMSYSDPISAPQPAPRPDAPAPRKAAATGHENGRDFASLVDAASDKRASERVQTARADAAKSNTKPDASPERPAKQQDTARDSTGAADDKSDAPAASTVGSKPAKPPTAEASAGTPHATAPAKVAAPVVATESPAAPAQTAAALVAQAASSAPATDATGDGDAGTKPAGKTGKKSATAGDAGKASASDTGAAPSAQPASQSAIKVEAAPIVLAAPTQLAVSAPSGSSVESDGDAGAVKASSSGIGGPAAVTPNSKADPASKPAPNAAPEGSTPSSAIGKGTETETHHAGATADAGANVASSASAAPAAQTGASHAHAAAPANPAANPAGANTATAALQSGQQSAPQDAPRGDASASDPLASGLSSTAGAASASPASSSTASPATTPAAPAYASSAVLQVATRAIERFDGRAQRFDVRLDPAELGRVDVRIEVGADRKVHAVLAAHDSAALSDLMRGSRALEKALSDAGIDLADNGIRFELSADGGAAGGQDRSNGWTPQSDGGWGRGASIAGIPVDSADVPVAHIRTGRGAQRLDLMA